MMQTYSSAIDGKTLIRVGDSGQTGSTLTLPGSSRITQRGPGSQLGTSMTLQRGPNMTMTSSTTTLSRRPAGTASSNVTVTSLGASNGGDSNFQTNSAVTVKSVAPGQKMTSIIDTKSGIVTSSVVSLDKMTSSPDVASGASQSSSSSASMTSLISYGPETPSVGRFQSPPSSPQASSVLMTSETPFDTGSVTTTTSSSKTTSLLISSSIPMTSPVPMTSQTQSYDVSTINSHRSTARSVTKNPSVVIASLPVTDVVQPGLLGSPDPEKAGSVILADVHAPPKPGSQLFQSLDDSQSDGFSSIGASDSASTVNGTESFAAKSPPRDLDETGSLLSDRELSNTDRSGSGAAKAGHMSPAAVVLPVLEDPTSGVTAEQQLPSPVNQSSSTAFGVSPKPPSRSSSIVESSASADPGLPPGNGNDSRPSSEAGTRSTSMFNFIGWDVGSAVEDTDDRKCHRVLVYKDKDIVLMFKASCVSDKVGDSRRLHSLMTDIAVNCAQRLKKMIDMTLPKLQSEHMDTLPLTDARSTKEHLAEISRELKETVTINDVAYRYQPQKSDSFIGTHVDRTKLSDKHCEIGQAGVIVVLAKKSRFATVEAFSDQLCRHIVSARPASLGRLSDADLRKLNQVGPKAAPERSQADELLGQAFSADQSIVVAEAARRSFVRIEDFLLFS